jgi:hypothetical protein
MDDFSFAGKERTGLMGMAANGNDKIPRLVEKFINKLRLVVRYIHTRFGHGLDRQRVETMDLHACRSAFNYVTLKMLCPAFSHLAATGISGA